MNYSINGKFLTRFVSGQERFAFELLRELDKIVTNEEMELIVPIYVKNIPSYKSINIVRYGILNPILWEQIEYPRYLKKNKKIGINLCTSCPIIKPDVVVIHDICQVVHKEWFKSLYGRMSKKYYDVMRHFALCKAKKILTVSNFSKNEIAKYYNYPLEKILVIGNGWDHFKRVKEDDTIFLKHPEIKKGKYYFAASSLTPQKNYKWIREVARNNPMASFVISGKIVGLSRNEDMIKKYKNIIYLGYISDGEMKSLMKNCKAFIHPALYEGFGITPLEALSVGAKVIVSQAACLPEIYGNSAVYINPLDTNVNIDTLAKKKTDSANEVLKKYTWENMANKFYNYLKIHE